MPPKRVAAAKRNSGGQPAKASPVKKTIEQEESEDKEDEEEEVSTPKVTSPTKKAKASPKQQKGKNNLAKEEEEEKESSDGEEETKPAAIADGEDDASDGIDLEEKSKATNATAKKDSDDGNDEDNDDEETPAKEPVMVKDDDDDEEDDEEDEDSDSKKRKKAQTEKPAKKAKTDGEEKVTLFLENVKEIKEEKIMKCFNENEIIVTEVRMVSKKGNNCAFVDLENATDLEKALAMSGQKMSGNTIFIEKAKLKKAADEDGPKEDNKEKDAVTLFVKNLPYEVSGDDLKKMFTGCKEVRLPRTNGQSKGFAFIEFASAEEVNTAIEEKTGVELKGRKLFLDRVGPKGPKSRGEAGKTKVLFVKNLPYSLTGEGLQEKFEGCKSARIATFADSGKPRGFGFVEFNSPEDCKEAYESMQGREIEGRALTIDYASELDEEGGKPHRSPGNRRGGRGFGGRGRGGDRGRGGRGFRGRGGGRGGFRGGRGGRD